MTYTVREREQYNSYRAFACERLGIDKNMFNWFRREGAKLHQFYEDYCNGLFNDDGADSPYEILTNEIYTKVKNKASKLGLYVYFQTDPRGATIYLDRSPIARESYTNSVVIY